MTKFVDEKHSDSNAIIETQLGVRLAGISQILKADVVTFIGPIDDSAHFFLKNVIESISTRRRRLAVILETGGGFIESAERIASTLRHHYRHIDFIVPTFAMSAGTVLVMSGDSIYMDYSGTLGPIDPQIRRPGGGPWVPALGYLEQYDRLVQKSAAGVLTTAELAYMIQNFDPAELYYFEQARELSIALLEEWLVKFKFKNWRVTETRGVRVTQQMKRDRAAEIARQLNNTQRWHSHGRGIGMQVLRRELKLEIEDLEATPNLMESVESYYTLLTDYRWRRGNEFFITHWEGGYHGH